ncbi:hypothetical protein [Parachitinimonas caeni]|uniref:Uncharacterized protein n=1 Tax=Parachitinimonas caeni TaxID=3031301 RepID=A0ABT7DZV5_9NEIS|nr:hypothetical protein [Parachitinimonas caeni]MDK2125602.1 hypothetical protein [Parachitinimonas caeni]
MFDFHRDKRLYDVSGAAGSRVSLGEVKKICRLAVWTFIAEFQLLG